MGVEQISRDRHVSNTNRICILTETMLVFPQQRDGVPLPPVAGLMTPAKIHYMEGALYGCRYC